MFTAWTEIELFHVLRRTFKEINPEGDHTVTYRAKVKLHGSNAAVTHLPDGTLECQSRTAIITPESDNAGFARWVMSQKDHWLRVIPVGWTVFGEWCGPGIQKGMGLNQIPTRVFAVFAMVHREHGRLITEPAEIDRNLAQPLVPKMYVIPWYGDFVVTVNWDETPEGLAPVIDQINAEVAAVETCDPWVKFNFGVEGMGEGLVFYPMGQRTPEATYTYLRMFKAKGEKHKTVATKAPAQAEPEVAKNLADFAVLVVTEARLDQGAQAVKPDGATMVYDMKRMGDFLKWISKDVDKECQTELSASGLNAKAAMKAVSERARKWYLAKVNAE
jgi:hypothetical protein